MLRTAFVLASLVLLASASAALGSGGSCLVDCVVDGVPVVEESTWSYVGPGKHFVHSGRTWDSVCPDSSAVQGTNFAVVDLVSAHVHGSVGIDDFTGPIVDPVTNTCLGTDGAITPDFDSDDCLIDFVDTGAAPCGGVGGDDGYWIFLEPHAEENGLGTTVDGPTAGVIRTW